MNNPLPEIEGIRTSAYITTTYEPSQEEIVVFDRLTKHVNELAPIVKPGDYVPSFPTYSVKEFKKKLKKMEDKEKFCNSGRFFRRIDDIVRAAPIAPLALSFLFSLLGLMH